MTDTTQEELPPLPKNDRSVRGWDWPYSPQEMKAYARQCIATLKAENARLKADLLDSTWQDHADHWQKRAEAAQFQAAVMAGLLEEAQEAIAEHHVAKAAGLCINCDLLARIESALAAWKGKQ